LLEVIDNEYGVIYKRKDVDSDDGQEVIWEIRNKIANWPSLLCKNTSAPFLFSDNFQYRLDFDFNLKTLQILDVVTEIVIKIPDDMINTEWKGLTD